MWDAVLARIEPEVPIRRPSAWSQWVAGVSSVAEWMTSARVASVVAAACVVAIAVSVGVLVLRHRAPVQRADGGSVAHTNPPPADHEGAKPGDSIVAPPENGPKVPSPTESLPRRNTPPHRTTAPSTAPELAANALPLPVVHAEKQYLEMIALLSKDVNERGAIDEKLQKPLDDIDRSILVARKAVAENPKDTEAVLNMLSAYDQKVEVLQSLARFQIARNR